MHDYYLLHGVNTSEYGKFARPFAQGVLPSKEGCRNISPGDLSRFDCWKTTPLQKLQLSAQN